MRELAEQNIQCPHCGERIGILIDQSVPDQRYIEDCQVCCRPINLSIAIDLDGEVEIRATSDTE
jgi:hypothetical protein